MSKEKVMQEILDSVENDIFEVRAKTGSKITLEFLVEISEMKQKLIAKHFTNLGVDTHIEEGLIKGSKCLIVDVDWDEIYNYKEKVKSKKSRDITFDLKGLNKNRVMVFWNGHLLSENEYVIQDEILIIPNFNFEANDKFICITDNERMEKRVLNGSVEGGN